MHRTRKTTPSTSQRYTYPTKGRTVRPCMKYHRVGEWGPEKEREMERWKRPPRGREKEKRKRIKRFVKYIVQISEI